MEYKVSHSFVIGRAFRIFMNGKGCLTEHGIVSKRFLVLRLTPSERETSFFVDGLEGPRPVLRCVTYTKTRATGLPFILRISRKKNRALREISGPKRLSVTTVWRKEPKFTFFTNYD